MQFQLMKIISMTEFHSILKKNIVYSTNVNPCKYVAATLQGCGIRDDDFARSFGRMIKKNFMKKEPKWPVSADELIESLDSEGPFKILYNVIAWSLHPERSLTEHEYVNTM